MTCLTGSLATIRDPENPEECGCECDLNDLAYTGQASECTGVLPNEKLDSVLNKILTKICDIDSEINVTDIEWGCIPNAVAPTGGTVESNIQFLADELIPRSGNDCNCAITDDLYFEDGKGIYQCPVEQDSGSLYFSSDYTYLNADLQTRVTSDLKVTNGFGAGYSEKETSTDLSVFPTDLLDYTYGIDASAGDVTITLSQIASASLDHKNRRFCIRRLDCNTTHTGTIQAYAGETIENAGSITVPIGHAYIIQADDATNNWVIVAEYFGCDTLEAQADGDIYMAYNLGVGTNNASAKLHVLNADTALVTAKLVNSGVAAADMLQVSINGTVTDVIDEEGNLGVGISVPLARLNVKGEGATSATDALIVEDSTGLNHLEVSNSGDVTIRSVVNKKFLFNTSGGISAIDDSGIIRPFTITSDLITLDFSRFSTTNSGLSPSAASSATFFEILPTIASAAGVNPMYIFKVNPTINLTGTATGNLYGFFMDATITSMAGIFYGVVIANSVSRSGFGVQTPLSNLETGSFGAAIRTITGATTADITDHTVLADMTTGAYTLTLPAANTCKGRIYVIKKISNDANVLTISPSIDGSSQTITNQYAFYMVQSNGTAYFKISNN